MLQHKWRHAFVILLPLAFLLIFETFVLSETLKRNYSYDLLIKGITNRDENTLSQVEQRFLEHFKEGTAADNSTPHWVSRGLALLYEWRGDVNLAEREWSGARTNYEKALAADAVHFSVYHKLGELLTYTLQDYQAAIDLLEKSREIQKSAYELVILGHAYQRSGQADNALKTLQQSVSIAPHAYNNAVLGDLYFQLGKHMPAIWHYRISLRYRNQNPWVWYRLGLCYEKIQNRGKARQAFAKAVEQNPDFLEAKQALSRLE